MMAHSLLSATLHRNLNPNYSIHAHSMASSAAKALGLSHSAIWRENEAFINGKWVAADDSKSFTVHNPATNEKLASVPTMGRAETEKAIEAASKAWATWRKTTLKERTTLLKKWNDLMICHQEDLGKIITAECGKPLAEAKGEAGYGASFVQFYAEASHLLYGEIIPGPTKGRRILVNRQPIGVAALITPWNFPNAMITRKAAPALAAGCTVVIKPSEDTPLSALALAQLALEAGFPEGVINVVTGPRSKAAEIGETLATSPLVRKLSFTGSTAVGKTLMAQCASTVKKVSLELGGNAPFIVFDDANIDEAVKGCVGAKFRNNGQTCVCVNRIFVQDSVYDEFVEKLTKAVKALRVGNGMEPGVECGPLINEAATKKVQGLLDDSVKGGAKVVCGGEHLGGNFISPTVLKDISTDAKIHEQEIFGPIAAVYKFKTEDEAIAMANNTTSGLAGYFYSRDIGRVWRVAEELEYGMIGVNDGTISFASAPFGGVKESGIGREGSLAGLEEYMEMKYICMGGL